MTKTLAKKFCTVLDGARAAHKWVTLLLAFDEVFQCDPRRDLSGLLPGVYYDHKRCGARTLTAKLRQGFRT